MKNRGVEIRVAALAAALLLAPVAAGGASGVAAEPVTIAQSEDPARSLRRQQQFTATVQALRTLEAMLASATLDDEARAYMRSQLEALLQHYESSNGPELKIARLKLEMHDLREKQGGAISGGNIETFADQEKRLRQRELEILLQIRELEREIDRTRK